VALPNLDNVPVESLKTGEDKTPVTIDFFQWITQTIDTINEALIQIDNRLTAGGL
jgi:hypothetical protein